MRPTSAPTAGRGSREAPQTAQEVAAAEANKALDEQKKHYELEHQNAARSEKSTKRELLELEGNAKELDESLQQLETRLASVTAELSQVKLSSSLGRHAADDEQADAGGDDSTELLAYRDVSGAIATAFKRTLKSRLGDPGFVEKLGDQGIGSRPEFCHVIWGSESADWKVHDPRDSTEINFGTLLEDVCRYWGLDHEMMALVDKGGGAWPLEGFVYDETSLSDGMTVWLTRLPHVRTLGTLELEYVQDERELPIAVQRRLNRERRTAQINRQTKESIRKQKERDRQALLIEMVKYAFHSPFHKPVPQPVPQPAPQPVPQARAPALTLPSSPSLAGTL